MTSLKNRAVLPIALMFFAAISSTQLFGQGTASISGRVLDASGAAVPSASVAVKNTGTSAPQNTVTDDQGRYTVPDLPIGAYDIEASKTGFQNFDLRHNISANVVYLFPFKGNRLVEGWQITGIQTWHTGVPFSLGEGALPFLGNNFDTPRPDYVGGCNVYANQNVHQWYNPACFVPSPYGTLGTLGRNNLVGPGYVETDLGVMKETRIAERVSIQFRAELFNLFNHPNFNIPVTGAFTGGATPNPTAGQITSLVGSGGLSNVARQTQFNLKLLF